ncbi:MAG: hypothetical protein OEO20_11455 [Gemmatimonadota bacterium]|nr:hypothetical protein [Gemmatimonadota bacterium]MDH3366521.1 hypothetical protein [Gemmatimonadota bacterium]MDH3478910.1 hypothetical protein [Gemmatimonadota bacterium]
MSFTVKVRGKPVTYGVNTDLVDRHAVAQCSECEWNDHTHSRRSPGHFNINVHRHVEQTGHEVNVWRDRRTSVSLVRLSRHRRPGEQGVK